MNRQGTDLSTVHDSAYAHLMAEKPQILSSAEMAERANLTIGSFRSLRSRGKVPEPDGYVGRSPFWSERTARFWLHERAERGPRRRYVLRRRRPAE